MIKSKQVILLMRYGFDANDVIIGTTGTLAFGPRLKPLHARVNKTQ